MNKKTFLIFVVSLIFTIGISYVLFAQGPLKSPWANAFAGSDEVRGFAWSSNIGWISFNCIDRGTCSSSDYKVTMDLSNGVMSGYAWSSNIGWIDVDPAGANARPSDKHGVQINLSDGTMSGWMRALSYGGGWDGWIKITDAKVGQGGTITNSAGTGGGWAWGSDVIGWVRFSNTLYSTVIPHAECDFSANPTTITPPQKSTLSWQCNGLTTVCAIDNGVGLKFPIAGTRDVRPTEATTYTLTCQGFSGPVIKIADVSLGATSTTKLRIREVSPSGQ